MSLKAILLTYSKVSVMFLPDDVLIMIPNEK